MTDTTIPLRCLAGRPAPEGLGAEIQRLLEIPEPAMAPFPQVLAMYLAPKLDEATRQQITGYFKQFRLDTDYFIPTLRGLRMLFYAHAESGAKLEEYAADLADLLPEQEAQALTAITQPWLEEVAPQLRQEALRQSIADHGKVVTKTRWRIDIIDRSDRATRMSVPVGVVTLNYQEGDDNKRITLSLLPDQLGELRDALNTMLG